MSMVKLTYDFSIQESYRNITSTGQKEVATGVFALLAGDGDQKADYPSFDLNSSDRSFWLLNNGNFDRYNNADFNLNGDVNAIDNTFWLINNGIFSAVPK